MIQKPKAYVAGPYNGDDVVDIIENCTYGLSANGLLLTMGYRTFCPWSDFLEALFCPARSAREWKNDSLDELLDSDLLVLVDNNPRWQKSQGTIDELATCAVHGIPILCMSNMDDLNNFLTGWYRDHVYAKYGARDKGDNKEVD